MYERFVLSLYALCAFSFVFGWLSWRKRSDPGGTPMVLFHVALSVGALAYAGDISATTLSTQLRYRQIATVAQGTVAIAWLYAALQYANFDRSLTRRVAGILALDPLLLVVGFLLPTVTFLQTPATGTTGSLLHATETQLTPLFLVHMGTILVTALAGTIVLIQLFVRSRHLYRTQAAAVLVAALAPWTIALSQQYFLQIPEDATIFAWGVSGAALTAGLYTFKTLDPVPAAQSAIVTTMGDGTVVLDVDGQISSVNPAGRTLLADGEAPLVGRHIGSVIEDWEALATEEEGHRDWEELELTVEGDQRFLEVETTSFTDRFDDEVGTLVVLRDITDRKRREQRLEQYKLIFDSVTEPVYVLDDEDCIVRYNEPFAELVGYESEALVGDPISVVLGPEPTATDGGVDDHVETTVTTRDGRAVPCELDLAPVELDESIGRVGIIRDISERKAIESELAQTTEQLETLVSASPLAIISHDESGAVDVWNPAAESLFGWQAEEVRGERLPILPEDNYDELLEQHGRIQDGEHITGWETELRCKDGRQIPTRVSAAPIRNTDGDIVGTVSIIADITEQKARQRRLERQNERLDEFASLVSHDLRNPLQVATGHLHLARETDDPATHIADAEAAIERMEALIDDTLSLARQGRDIGETEVTGLSTLADRAWSNVASDGSSLDVVDAPTADCDPDRVVELLENLFSNALTHGPADDDDRVTITVGSLEDGFYVADDGVGIPQSRVDRVLESGFTTAEGGTGFGLDIVETIADAHGWHLSVGESESGGARFEFRF